VAAHRFGDFVLDADTRELFRNGAGVHLSPRAFQLLHALVRNSPRAMSKTELQELLWPDTFVIEANLQHLVGEVRTALADDPKRPRFLRTVYGFGYAFNSPTKRAPSGRSQTALCRLHTDNGPITLADGDHLVGRSPTVDVVLDSATVSRRHARISVKGTEVTVEDLGSRNGSFAHGRRIEGLVKLADGDTVRFGRVVVRLRVYSRWSSTRSSSGT
jgi:DNA-binding winged helix-turn-helix (wHTH) protein